MSTHTQVCYHIVFSTKAREPTLKEDRREHLFRYIWGILNNRESHLYRINGTEDHLHILTSLHPSVSLADLVKDVKTGSSIWIKKEGVFRMFSHWQDGYAAFLDPQVQTCGYSKNAPSGRIGVLPFASEQGSARFLCEPAGRAWKPTNPREALP
jgi:REP element-mobilizing transposase RayT